MKLFLPSEGRQGGVAEQPGSTGGGECVFGRGGRATKLSPNIFSFHFSTKRPRSRLQSSATPPVLPIHQGAKNHLKSLLCTHTRLYFPKLHIVLTHFFSNLRLKTLSKVDTNGLFNPHSLCRLLNNQI